MEKIKQISAALALSLLMIGSSASLVYAATEFGGVILQYVPTTPTCPVNHTLIYDFATNTIFGIAQAPGSILYDYGNLYTTGAFVLGNRLLTTIPCALPYPVYPFYQVGTSPF